MATRARSILYPQRSFDPGYENKVPSQWVLDINTNPPVLKSTADGHAKVLTVVCR